MTQAAAPVVVGGAQSGTAGETESTIRANRRRAIGLCVLPCLLSGFVVGVIIAAAGKLLIGLCVFVAVTAVGSFLLWRRAPRMVVHAVGSRTSHEADQPRVHSLVEGLCATMGLPVPSIRVVDSPIPNAMAVGRDPHVACLVVTTGLEESLSLVELEGVLAHELVHVKCHDTVLAGVAVCVAVPWAAVKGTEAGAETVHRLVGRGREFVADQRAAGVVRYPPGLAAALDTMTDRPVDATPWPPGTRRTAALTRWLWTDPLAGTTARATPVEGDLDDTRVRAAALSIF